MYHISRNKSQIIVAILAGLAGSFFWGQIMTHTVKSIDMSLEVFYCLYSSIAALIITWIGTVAPWKWISALIVANYLSGYAFIQFWGQFGPFDLIFMAVYSIPCLLVSYALIYLKKLICKLKATRNT
jgi:phosphatidylserine synthase